MFNRSTLIALAVAVVGLLGLAGVAHACSCIRYASAAEQYAKADAVFEGRVVRTERVGRDRASTTFVVLDRLKGRMGRQIRVEHGTETGGACGVKFKRGEIVGLTVNRERNGWTTSSCAAIQYPWVEYRRAAGRRR